ncbi:hypothetical protein TcWFU_009891 [Taenia crassiceps]|uniref:Uncharacterized protein n=1 Tax=Taenia crassiceps TaxID=6207 RepID=A0ABR4Q2J1_9CEST
MAGKKEKKEQKKKILGLPHDAEGWFCGPAQAVVRMRRYLVCILVLTHLVSALPTYPNDYHSTDDFMGGETTDEGIGSMGSAFEGQSEGLFTISTGGGIGLADEVTSTEEEEGTDVQEATETVVTNMDNGATNASVTKDLSTSAAEDQTRGDTDATSNQAINIEEIINQVTGVYATVDPSEAQPVTMVGEEEGTTEASVPTDIEFTDVADIEGSTVDAVEEEVGATTDGHTEVEDAEEGSNESTTEMKNTLDGGSPPENEDLMTTDVEEEDYTTGGYPMEAMTTEEKVEGSTETSANVDVKLTDGESQETSITDNSVSTTDGVGDEAIAITDDLADLITEKDIDDWNEVEEEETNSMEIPMEGGLSSVSVNPMTTLAVGEVHATESYPLEKEKTEEVVEATTEASVTMATELFDATATESMMTDTVREEVEFTADGEKAETTDVESSVEGRLSSESVDPMTTMVAGEGYATEAYSMEAETTEEVVEDPAKIPVLTDIELTDSTMTTATEEELHTTNEYPMKAITTKEEAEESADTSADLTGAVIMECSTADCAAITTDAMGDELSATTNNPDGELVKKNSGDEAGVVDEETTMVESSVEDGQYSDSEDQMTTMAVEEDYTTRPYSGEAEMAKEDVEDKTEASVATDIEFTDVADIEGSTVDAVEEEVGATTDGHTEVEDAEEGSNESTTEMKNTLDGGSPPENEDLMTTDVEEEDYTTGGYPMEAMTTEEKVEGSAETSANTDFEATDAGSPESLTTNCVDSTDRVLEEEATKTTDTLTDMLVKKDVDEGRENEREETTMAESTVEDGLYSDSVDQATTVVVEGDSTTDAYAVEEKMTGELVEGVTEAPVATDVELINATAVEGLVTDAIKVGVEATTYGEKEGITEVESNVEGEPSSESVDPIVTTAKEEGYTTLEYPMGAKTTGEIVGEVTGTSTAIDGDLMANLTAGSAPNTAGTAEGEESTTLDGLTVVGNTEADVNESTAESMTPVTEEEIHPMKEYLLGAVTTEEVVEETEATHATDAELTDAAVLNISTTTTDSVSGVCVTDDNTEVLAKKNVGDESQPGETPSSSQGGLSSASPDAIATMTEEEKSSTAETTSAADKFFNHHVFTGLWTLDNHVDKIDGPGTSATVGTGEDSDSEGQTSQVTDTAAKAAETEVVTVVEGVIAVTGASTAGLVEDVEATSVMNGTTQVHQEPGDPKTSAVAKVEDAATTDEQEQISPSVTVGTPPASPEADSTSTDASLTSRGLSEEAIPSTLLEENPSKDGVVAAASFGAVTSDSASIRSGLSLSLSLLFSHLLLQS